MLLLGSKLGAGKRTWNRSAVLKERMLYSVVCLAWAVSATFALTRSYSATGAICPIGRRGEQYVPFAQLVMCFTDAVILVGLDRIRCFDTEFGTDPSISIHKLFLTAAGCVFLSFSPAWIGQLVDFSSLRYLGFGDLFLDSALTAVVILCGWLSLPALHPTTLGALVSYLCLFGFKLPYSLSGFTDAHTTLAHAVIMYTPVAILTGCLFRLALPLSSTSQPNSTRRLERTLFTSYIGSLFMCSMCWIAMAGTFPPQTLEEAIASVMDGAYVQFEQWKVQAKTSTTLQEAVIQYKRRYAIPPPPNFDKWYYFASERNSVVIDEFDQIHNDLLPFWGIEPATIRTRTAHLLHYSDLGMGGLRIRGGNIDQSPNISGTHRWMTETISKMIQPFAEWLPDMDIAFNLDDECQVAVPFEDMQVLKQTAKTTRAEMTSGGYMHAASTLTQHDWPAEWAETQDSAKPAPSFFNRGSRQIYYNKIAPTCPPESNARRMRWWDTSTMCIACAKPHSIFTRDGAVVANEKLSRDLCHQPDVAYLSGFVRAPAVSVLTGELFPVFSQSRASGFSDILIPSPWHYSDKTAYQNATEIPWKEKQNKLFWRGTSSDGYAHAGSWTGFLRARFVHEANKIATSVRFVPNSMSQGVNVSFTGNINKCDDAVDCSAEMKNFQLWATSALPIKDGRVQTSQGSSLPLETTFEEHWKYKHLIDLDGAAFSGRFLSFLKSTSLPYRAGIFSTWMDERLYGWHHYVPIDFRLGIALWGVFDFFSGGSKYRHRAGDDLARKIAENGRAWANTAIRHEDMEVYMFRLLLEWSRLIDDDREHLGYMSN